MSPSRFWSFISTVHNPPARKKRLTQRTKSNYVIGHDWELGRRASSILVEAQFNEQLGWFTDLSSPDVPELRSTLHRNTGSESINAALPDGWEPAIPENSLSACPAQAHWGENENISAVEALTTKRSRLITNDQSLFILEGHFSYVNLGY